MSKFKEIFENSNFKTIETLERNQNTKNLNKVVKPEDVFNKIKKFEDISDYFYFKNTWKTRNDDDIYQTWLFIQQEIYCLFTNLKYDYIMNVNEDNTLTSFKESITPDIVIRNTSSKSVLNKLDTIEFKVKNGLISELAKREMVKKKNNYERVQNEIWKTKEESINTVKRKCIWVVINDETIKNIKEDFGMKYNQNHWLFRLNSMLKDYLYNVAKTNKRIFNKMQKQNNMTKVITFLAEKSCLEGNKYFINMEEKWPVFEAKIKEDCGNYDDKISLYDNLVINEKNCLDSIQKNVIDNLQYSLNNINANICKVEKLLDSYKKLEEKKPTISRKHPYSRTKNRKKYNTDFGHKAKYLLDFPVQGLIIKKEENFEKIIFEEMKQKSEKIVIKIRTIIDNLNKWKSEEDNVFQDSRNKMITKLEKYNIFLTLFRIIGLQNNTRLSKNRMEELNNNISTLKSFLKKEVNYAGMDSKTLEQKLTDEKKQLQEERDRINKEIKKVDKKASMNSKGYIDIKDAVDLNIGINLKTKNKKLLNQNKDKNNKQNNNTVIYQKNYKKDKIYEDMVDTSEEEYDIKGIAESINKIKWEEMRNYWPRINALDPYNSDIDKLANILLQETYRKLNNIDNSWVIKYNMIKYWIFKQISLIAPFTAGKSISSESFAGKQVDNLNMYVIATPYPKPETGGMYFMITEHTMKAKEECEKGIYIKLKNNNYIRVSTGTRTKAHEHKDFEKIFACIAGLYLLKQNFKMGESILFDSYFLRFNRECVKMFEHINIIMKNSFCDHTLGKIDMQSEFEGLQMKDLRISQSVQNINKNYIKMVSSIKSQDILNAFSFEDSCFGFNVTNLQAYTMLVYLPTYFPKNDGFQAVRILCNFLIKDIEQEEKYQQSPFNDTEVIKNNFYLHSTRKDNINRCFIDDTNYWPTCFNPDLIFYQCFKTYKNGRPQKQSRCIDNSLMNSSSSSSTKEYLFNIGEDIIKRILNISKIKESFADILRECKEQIDKEYVTGSAVSINKIVDEILKKYKLSSLQFEKVKTAILRQIERNKLFIYDIKLPESNMNAANNIYNKYQDKEIKKRLIENGIYSEREINELKLEDIKTSDLILSAFTRNFATYYQPLWVLLDSFPKLQRGFNKRLIYQMFNNPVGTMFATVDQMFLELLKKSNVDIITKPGAKKYELLETMAKEVIAKEKISFFIVDQKRYGDKYSVHALMLNAYFNYKLGYFTKEECIFVLEIASMLLRRGTIVPEKIARKMEEIINMDDDKKMLERDKNSRLYDEVSILITGLLKDKDKKEIQELWPGLEMNKMIKKGVGFVLGVFNTWGSATSDGIAQLFISIIQNIIPNIRAKGKTQSDDVLYCFGLVLLDILEKDVNKKEILEFLKTKTFVSNDREGLIDENLLKKDSTVFIHMAWAILLTIQLASSQTFSPKKTAFSNYIGEILQTLLVKTKSISPLSKDFTTMGNSMFFSSMVKDFSGCLGNVYSLFLNGACNQLVNDAMMLAQYLVRYFYRMWNNDRKDLFKLPLENGGLFYIYPDLLRIHGFMGNYVRLLSLCDDQKQLIFLSNCLNNNTVFIKNKRVKDNNGIISEEKIKKVVEDSSEDNYAGSCFKDFKIRKGGNTYVKENLYAHFFKTINSIIESIISNISNFSTMNVNINDLYGVLAKICLRNDLNIKKEIRDEILKYFDDSEMKAMKLDNRPIRSFVNSVLKELESVLAIPLKLQNLKSLKQITFLTKYLKESFQEGYVKENQNLNRRHLVNFGNWKVLNMLSKEARVATGMNELTYGIKDMMEVCYKLEEKGFYYQKNLDFLKMNIEAFNTEIKYIKEIEIKDISIVEAPVNREQGMKWVETKEILGFTNIIYNINDILLTIFQEDVLLLDKSMTTIIEKKPFLLLEKRFRREVENMKTILEKYGMLNERIIDNIDLFKKILSGQVRFKTFRTMDVEKSRVFDSSLMNFGLETNISANINETNTTSSKIKTLDLNQLNPFIDDALCSGVILKNHEVEKVRFSDHIITNENIKQIINETNYELRYYYYSDWLQNNKERSFNFYMYYGKNSKHYFIFDKSGYTRMVAKGNKVKIVSTRNDLQLVTDEAYLIGVSLLDEKIYSGIFDIKTVSISEKQRNKEYYFLISNDKIAYVKEKTGNLELFIGVENNIIRKFDKKVPIFEDIRERRSKKKIINVKTKAGKTIKKEIEESVLVKVKKQTDWLYIGSIGIFFNNIIKMIDLKVIDNIFYKKEINLKIKNLYKEITKINNDIKDFKDKNNKYKGRDEMKDYKKQLELMYRKKEETFILINQEKRSRETLAKYLHNNRLKDNLSDDFSKRFETEVLRNKKKLRLFANIRIVNSHRKIIFSDLKVKYKGTDFVNIENGLEPTDNVLMLDTYNKIVETNKYNNFCLKMFELFESLIFGTVGNNVVSFDRIFKILMINRVTLNLKNCFERILEIIRLITETIKITTRQGETLFFIDKEDVFIEKEEIISEDEFNKKYVNNSGNSYIKVTSAEEVDIDRNQHKDWADLVSSEEEEENITIPEEESEGEYEKNTEETSHYRNFEGSIMSEEEYQIGFEKDPKWITSLNFRNYKKQFKHLVIYHKNKHVHNLLHVLNNIYNISSETSLSKLRNLFLLNGIEIKSAEYNEEIEKCKIFQNIKDSMRKNLSKSLSLGEIDIEGHQRYMLIIKRLFENCLQSKNNILESIISEPTIDEILVLSIIMHGIFGDINTGEVDEQQKIPIVLGIIEKFIRTLENISSELGVVYNKEKYIKKYYYNKSLILPIIAKFVIGNTTTTQDNVFKKKDTLGSLSEGEIDVIKKIWKLNNIETIIQMLETIPANKIFKSICLRKIEIKHDYNTDVIFISSIKNSTDKQILSRFNSSAYSILSGGVILKGFKELISNNYIFSEEL